MTNILTDIKSAVKLTGEIRKARKEGASIEARKVWKVPVIKTDYWGWTMEACLLCGSDAGKAAVAVFETFPEPVQHTLTFCPQKPGEWVERARFWQAQFKPALPPKMYHDAMIKFISWYAHCLRMRKGREEHE